MSPRIENAIHLPSGLHAGSSGPEDTAGNMCRSSRSEWPYRFGRATTAARVTPARPSRMAGFLVGFPKNVKSCVKRNVKNEVKGSVKKGVTTREADYSRRRTPLFTPFFT